MTEEEILALIGPAALAEAERIADAAPPFRPEQRAALAIILARPAEQAKRRNRTRPTPAA
ncbi:MAG: hypothetical protein AB7W59_01735 [Acidimicrobiia bacterium]